jgi:TPR repeat protein
MAKLGYLLTETSRVQQAEQWFRKAGEAGDTYAMNSLGYLLNQKSHVKRLMLLRIQPDADHGAWLVIP